MAIQSLLGSFPFFLKPLFLVIAFDWSQLDMSLQIIFPALAVLDLLMTWRAFKAYRVFQSRPTGWQSKYMDHVGFNIISFSAGFFIVLAIDLGAPIWLVVVIAVLSIVGGIFGVNKVKAKENILNREIKSKNNQSATQLTNIEKEKI